MDIETWNERRKELVGRDVAIQGQRRTIIGTYESIVGGINIDRPVGDFHSWNLDAVEWLDSGWEIGRYAAIEAVEDPASIVRWHRRI